MDLNPEQLRAVEHGDGPLLILAGAGSGKTRVLIHRIAHLLRTRRARPHELLAVTFTNKAAREMRTRVEQMIGQGAAGIWLTTFHSTGLRILRQEAQHLGLARDFVVYDEDDQVKLIRAVCAALNLDDKRNPPRSLAAQISRAKDQCLGPAEVAAVAKETYGEKMAEVYALYQKRLSEARACDFGDLIYLVVRLFREHPAICARYQERFRHLLIDEYQDTNHAQYQLVRLLTQARQNLAVVGDPDQSVYAWRGADLNNILSFEKDYQNATVIKLEQNYRSSKRILDAANAVITNNQWRKPKDLWTENLEGAHLTVQAYGNDLDEARNVIDAVRTLVAEGSRRDEIAIFYRINAQSRVFEEAFRTRGIPYQIFGGIRFYERREVKDCLAYLRLLVNPHDGVSLERVINLPPRGIGKTTVDRLIGAAARRGISVYELLGDSSALAEFAPGTRRRLAEFRVLIDALRTLCAHPPLGPLPSREGGSPLRALFDHLLECTGYVRWLGEVEGEEAEERIANVEELARAMEEYRPLEGEPTLTGFLDQVALVSDIDRLEDGACAVVMTTMHMAKGLEFDCVFLVGMEEGLFPHSRAMDDPEELEEERRLCYVGMTRARKQLTLTYAHRRRLHGREQYNVPSRFLEEIPEELIEPQASDVSQLTDDDFNQCVPDEMSEGFRVGHRVMHPTFGEGIVRRADGCGEKQKITVQFDYAGLKTLISSYVRGL
ncbi:MAG: UvrD-helicase domain-containing protein [Deltaproteobacteria bacterium]|nr:UvrD-helicase domain-containing protein [Deltaproteobacteria bacterium]